MKLTRTWIDTHLSHDERTRLVEWLLERSQNPTGELILSGLQELFPALGDFPSLQSCLTWRNKAWAFELHRRDLRAESEAARILADDGSYALGEANRKLTDAYVFEQLRALREGGAIDQKAIHKWILSAALLAKSSRDTKKLESELELQKAKLKEYEAKEAERREKAAAVTEDATLSDAEKRARISEIFNL